MVHRDLKPENIMQRKSTDLVLADFGFTDFAVNCSQPVGGNIPGTLPYLAPENHYSKKVDFYAVDMFAAGCIFFEMLAVCRFSEECFNTV